MATLPSRHWADQSTAHAVLAAQQPGCGHSTHRGDGDTTLDPRGANAWIYADSLQPRLVAPAEHQVVRALAERASPLRSRPDDPRAARVVRNGRLVGADGAEDNALQARLLVFHLALKQPQLGEQCLRHGGGRSGARQKRRARRRRRRAKGRSASRAPWVRAKGETIAGFHSRFR